MTQRPTGETFSPTGSKANARLIVKGIGEALVIMARGLVEPESNVPFGFRRRPGGLAALFHAYADMAEVFPDDSDACSTLIDADLDRIQRSTHLALYGGWAGPGWLTTHLDAEDDVVGTHVDWLAAEALARQSDQRVYDLISGVVGVGVYFVERLPRDSAVRGLGLVLEVLERMAVETKEGTTWFTVADFLPAWQRKLAPAGYYNLGVAHGVPGVCWLLGKLCSFGIEPGRAEPLLRDSLRWLRAIKSDPTEASLPSWIAPGVEPEVSRRLAWCYGPLGASAVAFGAAKAIGDREGVEWARTLALACARIRPDEAQIRDAGLCHGAAGNAQIFYRLARTDNEPEFANAAKGWVDATLNWWRPNQGVGGYRMWGDVGGNRQGWVDDGSFLTGSAGVGLALLTGTTDIEPKWDRLLLLS